MAQRLVIATQGIVIVMLTAAVIWFARLPSNVSVWVVTGEPILITTTPLPPLVVTATPSQTPVIITATFAPTWTPDVVRVSATPLPTLRQLEPTATVTPNSDNAPLAATAYLAPIFQTATAVKALQNVP